MQRIEVIVAAELRVECARIDDVVPVRASPSGLQDRRGINVGDPKLREVRSDATGGIERKAGVELQPVRGERDTVHPYSAVARALPGTHISGGIALARETERSRSGGSMSRVEPIESSEVKRYGDPRRTRDERVAQKPSQAEGDEQTVDEALRNQDRDRQQAQ